MAKTDRDHAGRPPDERQSSDWPQSGWDDHDEASSHRARRLLSRRAGWSMPHVGDWLTALGHRISGTPGLRWTALGAGIVVLVPAVCFALLWWRLGAGPINVDLATPWLVSAIEDNLGSDHKVEVGGTQIERAGRARIALRLRDIVVRDRDQQIVASAPKAEVRVSGSALLVGRLRAESLNLVGAELSVRITPEGRIIVSAGDNARPLINPRTAEIVAGGGTPAPVQGSSGPTLPAVAASRGVSGPVVADRPNRGGLEGLLGGLDWLDSLSARGLDGENLDEVGLKNGTLVVDDQQNGNRLTFENISLTLRRPSRGGVSVSLGEDGADAWSLKAVVGAPENGVRSIEVQADNVPAKNLILAMRAKGLTYTADLPLSGRLVGEIGRDGLPTYFRGKLSAGAGSIVDLDVPDYPMAIDQIDVNLEWDAGRRVLVAPFQIVSGANRITLLAHLEPPNDSMPNWQLGFSGGTVVLAGDRSRGDEPVIFNRVAIRLRFDTANKRVLMTQADVSNGEISIAGSGGIDYSGEPRLTLGLAGTPMPASALKRIWPITVTPEVRDWVMERVERGTIQRMEIGINAPMQTLSRSGPPIPDDGLSINFVASNVQLRPVDEMPSVRDADLKARVTGRTATVTISQAAIDTPTGRKMNISDLVFEAPDLVPKPIPARIRFRLEGSVPAAAELLASNRLSEFTGTLIDPNSSKGTMSAQVSLAMPLKNALSKADTTYSVNVDLGGFSADKLVMNQKLEGNSLKVIANNQGYQVRGDVKIAGQSAVLDYRKPSGDGDADVRLQTTLDDASRARFGFDLGSLVTGSIPVRVTGKIAGGDRDNRFGVEADLVAAKIDNLLPGWTKIAGRPGRVTFNVVQKSQSTRLEDLQIEGGGTLIKGAIEIDQSGDVVNAAFPTFTASEGDRASLRGERAADGTMKVTMRGDVFDGRNLIKSGLSGRDAETKKQQKGLDFDLDLKLGAVAGFYGEAIRGVDLKLSRRNGAVRSFSLNGKLGRDTPLIGDIRGKAQGRDVLYLETNDAGALFRFTDTYAKMVGGQMWIAIDPPTSENVAQEGLLNVRDFVVRGEAALERVTANGPNAGQGGSVSFSQMRAEITRKSGQLSIREGIVRGPLIGATIEGNINYPANQVRMSGTFVPMYGLNNMFGQIPIVGLVLGGGSNEGLIGVTYEVVGTPGAPVVRVNPISAMAPGVFRKIFEFGTGRQQAAPPDYSSSNAN